MSADILKLLIEAALACSLAIAVVLIFRMPFRRLFGARVAYTLWCLIPLALIAVLIPAREIVVTTASQVATHDAALAALDTTITMQVRDISSNLLLLLWTIGIVICAFWFSRQQAIFIASLGALKHRAGKIFSAESNIQGPSVIGVLQPRIVLPSDFDKRYSHEEQNLVLMHEQIHLARGDTRINFLAAFLRCIFWFNPLLHWAGGRFRFDQELSTDASVLSKFPLARKSYADAMLKTQMASIGLPIACHWQAHHPLKERILMLKKSNPGKTYRVLGFALVTALGLGGAFAAWSTQPADIIAAPGKAEFLYETKMDIDVDGDLQKDIVIREAPGQPASVMFGEGGKRWSFEFVLKPMENNRVLLTSSLKRGDELMGEPKLIFEIGKEAAIGMSTKDGSSVFKLNMQVRKWRDGKVVTGRTPVTKNVERASPGKKFKAASFTQSPLARDNSWRHMLKISFIVDPKQKKDDDC